MISNTIPWYIFIQTCIFFLHWIAPLSILYCLTSLISPPSSDVFRILQVWATLETAFYFLVYHPRRIYLQRPATHPVLASRAERRALVQRCIAHTPDPEHFLAKWFLDAPASEIKWENIKEFYLWAFFNTGEPESPHEEELEEYTRDLERLLKRKIEPGRGNAKCLRLTLDEVGMLHRSLTWYLCVAVVDTLASAYMRYYAFDFHRTSLRQLLSIFPFRLFTLLTPYRSPATTLTYWHRPHKSKTGLPILFIHGIGIGLYPYINFLSELNSRGQQDELDGDVGIIAVEIMPISFRITGKALQREEMCRQIDSIVKAHGWERFVLVSHSYGSVIATHLLQTPHIAQKIGATLFIDPITFLLHLPDVAYNFVYRKPVRANEHQLHYFGSKDMGVSHTLSRHFFWSENIMWKEDLRNHRATVALGGKDLIVDTKTVRAYLTNGEGGAGEKENGSMQTWKVDGLDVLWFSDLDHAQVFDRKCTRARLTEIVRGYCVEN